MRQRKFTIQVLKHWQLDSKGCIRCENNIKIIRCIAAAIGSNNYCLHIMVGDDLLVLEVLVLVICVTVRIVMM